MHPPFHARLVSACALLLLSACAPAATSTPFIPPAAPVQASLTSPPAPLPTADTPSPFPATSTTAPGSSPTPSITPTAGPCANGLSYLQDLTIPDGSIVQPGATIEKQWLVSNSGSCNWDASYRFKFVSGDLLGATAEQALYPARAGTQATLRITFIAPLETGTYQSAWQAFAPDGTPFGDAVYMTINVGF